ncbi:alpha/beta fold hydrolase [Halocola ammonii]
MKSNHQTVSHKDLKLEYITRGEGSQIILAFHGFGRKAEDFLLFEPLLRPDQKLVSVNIFQHGESRFPEHRIERDPVNDKEWSDLISKILEREKAESYWVMGYSLGGKLALQTSLTMAFKPKGILLFAPDGIKINKLYSFTSKTTAGRAIYKQVLKRPKPFFKLADLLKFLRIISDKIHRFVNFHMDTHQKRRLVYDTWLIFRNFEPNLREVALTVEKYEMTVHMLFGKYDKIIPPAHGEKMAEILKNPKSLHVLESGHLLLEEPTKKYLGEHNLWPS